MGVKVSLWKEKTRTVPVVWFDDTVQVTYAPGLLTGELVTQAEDYWKKMAKDETDRAPVSQLRFLLSKLIKAWDLVNDDGVPCSHDPTYLATLPTPFLMAINEAIAENERPKEKNESSFGAG